MRPYYEVPAAPGWTGDHRCTVEGCCTKYFGKGYCTKHYQRMRYTGGLETRLPVDLTPEERFWEKVSRGSADSCWLWLGRKDKKGYGAIDIKKGLRAHRLAYELFVSPLPSSMTLDHLCRNAACVNPVHMELVTVGENSSRMHKWRNWISEWNNTTMEKVLTSLS